MHPMVLVVDDEPAIVGLICEVLADSHIRAQGLTRPQHAAEAIRRLRPQVVILDVQMPELDGIQLFRQLRNDPATQHLPVIFCTANPEALVQRVPDYAVLGARLLPKPFRLQRLVASVEHALAAREPALVA